MTLKFESEILFDLMKRDGDDAPSDVLPYESELKEKYLNQVVGAYPKLQDYRPEWLNYNLYHHLPSDFPVESVTNVTSASFHNVVPYAYKSAILKGQTSTGKNLYMGQDTSNTDHDWVSYPITLEPNTYVMSNDGTLRASTVINNETGNTIATGSTFTITTQRTVLLCGSAVNRDKFQLEVGKEPTDYEPYCLVSVKMPVLTTTGKNLWKRGDLINFDTMFIEEIIPEGTYYLSGEQTTSYDEPVAIAFRDSNNNVLGHTSLGGKITINKKATQIAIYSNGHNYSNSSGKFLSVNNFMMEKDKLSSYEPYQSNILTTSEEVELRGIGDVKDELNLLTGEVTERIGEIVLDGSEDEEWVIFGENSVENSETISFSLPKTFVEFIPNSRTMMSDKYIFYGTTYERTDECLAINPHDTHHLQLRILKNKASTVAELKTYLHSNPIKIQGALKTESIKTVDLTCINEQGENETLRPIEGTMHVNTSSQTLLPLLDMSVPVEATSQNLMSFANIEGEE